MDHPSDENLPFFAYGLFCPGQIGYFQLRDFVQSVDAPATISGSLHLRDGLPILNPHGSGTVAGALLRFRAGAAFDAYERISKLEPDKQYLWSTATVFDSLTNVLIGRSPNRGSIPFEGKTWDGWDDPLFTAGLDVVQETIASGTKFDRDLKPMFRLQMAYLLLWSAIERYLSLRYHLGDRVSEKLNALATEPAFASAVAALAPDKRTVTRADRPRDKTALDVSSPKSAVAYYYQVRSNITHRGKGVSRDHDLLLKSATELLAIFRSMLVAAKSAAQLSAPP